MATACAVLLMAGCSIRLDLPSWVTSTSVGGATAGSTVIPSTSDPDYCDTAATWDSSWVLLESEVVRLINAWRAAGAVCGDAGWFGPAGPLTVNARLRCAARNHARDMRVRAYFGHVSLDGEDTGDRVDAAGYDWQAWGENIATGHTSAEKVVDAWINSPGHCVNVMNPDYAETGVGYYLGDTWVQVFGEPR